MRSNTCVGCGRPAEFPGECAACAGTIDAYLRPERAAPKNTLVSAVHPVGFYAVSSLFLFCLFVAMSLIGGGL